MANLWQGSGKLEATRRLDGEGSNARRRVLQRLLYRGFSSVWIQLLQRGRSSSPHQFLIMRQQIRQDAKRDAVKKIKAVAAFR